QGKLYRRAMEKESPQPEQSNLTESIEAQSNSLLLWVDWKNAAEEKPVLHANQIIAQIHDHEAFLSFFQVSPPVLLGMPEEIRKQLEGMTSMRPECVARINVTPRILKKMIKVLQETIDKFEAQEDDE